MKDKIEQLQDINLEINAINETIKEIEEIRNLVQSEIKGALPDHKTLFLTLSVEQYEKVDFTNTKEELFAKSDKLKEFNIQLTQPIIDEILSQCENDEQVCLDSLANVRKQIREFLGECNE